MNFELARDREVKYGRVQENGGAPLDRVGRQLSFAQAAEAEPFLWTFLWTFLWQLGLPLY
jgi:hypothetical protein